MIKAIHVDDDTWFLDTFKKAIKPEFEIQLIDSFTNAEDAYNFLLRSAVDILFLDIDMPTKNGFWLAEQIAHTSIEIIFVTTHTTYVSAAFEACAIDYIVKPATSQLIKSAIEKFKKRKEKNLNKAFEQIKEFYRHYMEPGEVPNRIFINSVGEVQIVPLEKVTYLSSANTYTEIFTTDGKKHLSSKHLKVYAEALIRNKDFVRIQRSYIVNKQYVEKILRDNKKNKVSVLIHGGKELEMAFFKREQIIQELLS